MPPNKRTSRAKRRAAAPGNSCWIPDCGYSFFTTLHRIVRPREGGRYEPGNAIRLCPNHHAEADRGHLPRDLLLAIVKERLSG